MANTVLLKKSNVVDKVPTASGMSFGEVYVNYASGDGKSFLTTKKQDGTLAIFPEKKYIEDKIENAITAASSQIINEVTIEIESAITSASTNEDAAGGKAVYDALQNYVSYDEQSGITEEQQMQARKNQGLYYQMTESAMLTNVISAFTWDGDTTDLAAVEVGDYSYYKISDYIPTVSQLSGGNFSLNREVADYSCENTVESGNVIYVLFEGELPVIFVAKESGATCIFDETELTFSEAGIYGISIDSIYLTNLTIGTPIEESYSAIVTTYHTIDNNYLSGVVKTSVQSLTDSEKSQARKNQDLYYYTSNASNTFEWDGQTTYSMTEFSNYESYSYSYKVSDITPSISDLVGGYIKTMYNDETSVYEIYEEDITSGANYVYVGPILVAYEDNVEITKSDETYNVPKKGLYFGYRNGTKRVLSLECTSNIFDGYKNKIETSALVDEAKTAINAASRILRTGFYLECGDDYDLMTEGYYSLIYLDNKATILPQKGTEGYLFQSQGNGWKICDSFSSQGWYTGTTWDTILDWMNNHSTEVKSDLSSIESSISALTTSVSSLTTTVEDNEEITARALVSLNTTKIGEPTNEGTSGQVLTTDGNGTRYWSTVEGVTDFEELDNRPKYNGSLMTGDTNIPEVKTSVWDGKQDAISDLASIRSGATLGSTAIQEPSAEGTSGQVLTTNGAGIRTWTTIDISSKEDSLEWLTNAEIDAMF